MHALMFLCRPTVESDFSHRVMGCMRMYIHDMEARTLYIKSYLLVIYKKALPRSIEQHAYPIFTEDWGADEELLLIEGAEMQGLGNWQDIADHIGGRSKEEVGEHYKEVYLDSPDYPLPPMKRKFDITAAEFAANKKERLDKRRNMPTALPVPKQKPTASVPACHEVQGFMPGRLEFETEHENEAEMAVKDMVFDQL